jgi:hypothetical protein
MTLSRPLQWLLALAVLASLLAALQDTPEPTPHKSPGIEIAHRARGATADKAQASAAWPKLPPSIDDPAWPQLTGRALYAWQAPPPAPPKSVALPKPLVLPPPAPPVETVPVAPRFPYKLIGQLEDQGQRIAILEGSNGLLTATADKLIDGQWQVVAVNHTGLDVRWVSNGQILKIGY